MAMTITELTGNPEADRALIEADDREDAQSIPWIDDSSCDPTAGIIRDPDDDGIGQDTDPDGMG